jgi:hypothetical protein
MRTIQLHNYSSNQIELAHYEDGIQINCLRIASKIENFFSGLGGVLHWIYFTMIDFLAPYIKLVKQEQYAIIENISKILIEKQNTFVSKRAEIKKIIDENYRSVEKNVDHLDEAEVILLGETHTRQDHRKINAKLIDALSEPSDCLFVEDGESSPHPEQSKQIQYIRKRLTTRGWDLDELKGLNVLIFAKMSRVFSLLFSLVALPATLATGSLPSAVIPWASANGILSITFFILGMKELKEINDQIIDRNRNLCKVIEKSIGADRRLFVIAGSGHFTPMSKINASVRILNLFYEDKSLKAYQETIDYLKNKKFAILIPK